MSLSPLLKFNDVMIWFGYLPSHTYERLLQLFSSRWHSRIHIFLNCHRCKNILWVTANLGLLKKHLWSDYALSELVGPGYPLLCVTTFSMGWLQLGQVNTYKCVNWYWTARNILNFWIVQFDSLVLGLNGSWSSFKRQSVKEIKASK